MIEQLDPDLNRTWISSADARLQIEKHLFATGSVQLAKLFRRQRRLPRDRFLEALWQARREILYIELISSIGITSKR